ncbi:hypothetical protein ACEPAG_9313 [Sanghuangporus baumii]
MPGFLHQPNANLPYFGYIYLIYRARSVPTNLYQILGVYPKADGQTITKAYRALAKKSHPDRAGPTSDTVFMEIREAYETLIKLLKDPVQVFAYERFGPSALEWFGYSTQMDYLERGTKSLIRFYFVFGIGLTCIALVIRRSPVIFWHYIILLSACLCELCLTVTSRYSNLLGMLIPGSLVFEYTLFIRRFFIYLSMALLGVVPALIPEEANMSPEEVKNLVVQEFRAVNLKLDGMNNRRSSLNGTTSSALPSALPSFSDRIQDLNEAEMEGSFHSIPRCNPRPEAPEMRTVKEEEVEVEEYLFS